MSELTLTLGKVRCMNCAGKIQAALSALPGVTSVSVDTQHAVIQGDLSPEIAIKTIQDLGYEAGFHYELPLAGLSCGKCVGKVNAALDAHDAVSDFHVTTTHLSITTRLSQAEVVALITALGFSVPEQAPEYSPAPDNALTTITALTLSGLSCGRCVAKVEAALAAEPAITHFTVSKTTASIESTLSDDALITLITELGYTATVADPNTVIEANTHTPAEPAEATSNVQPQAQTQSQAPGQTQQFILSGMTCASCVASVEKAIRAVDGVQSANVNLAERTALVSGDVKADAIIHAVDAAGYGAELSEDEQTRRERQQAQNAQIYRQHMRNAYIGLGVGIPLMAWGVFGGSMMITSTASQISWGLVGLLTLVLLLTVGRHFFVNAWKAFKHHRASMDTLVALGTGAAWLYSMLVVIAPDLLPMQARHVYFEASAMILGLITLGHALEARARSRTSKALEQLMDLQPPTAVIVENGEEREVPLAQVQAGMSVRLYPGSKVPVDGTIVQGQSYIDESMLTGEPLPANKQIGDTVHAGTINQHGTLLFTAEKIGRDTMLARIIDLVRQAQSSKPALARLADTISSIFVPTVMIIAVLTAMIWYYFGPDPSSSYMLVTATTVLIIACPCALGLATPMSVTVGIGRAAEYGVLIRNAEALQVAAGVDTVVLDKTGTLTEGKPQLVHQSSYHGFTDEQVLQLTASLEQGSEHPLGRAIIDAAKAGDLPLQTVEQFHATPGFGISGQVNGHALLLGNRKLLAQHGVDDAASTEDANTISHQGVTPIYVTIDGQLAGMLGVSDPLRHDSVEAIRRLQGMGLDVVMLTGDIEATAKAIAQQAGISQVIAGVLPDGKAAEVQRLQQQGKKVAMVGDGINDAPALAQAEVGIAMGSGSDVAIESAQLTLVRHSLHGVADAIQLSRATLKNMKQNLFGAFVYNTLGIPVAAGILFPFTGALLSPVVAGAAMALSSITVVSNANRLRLFTPSGAVTQHRAPESASTAAPATTKEH
ncbi:copper-translocating P-type ATPase [Photobacterium aphoticum]|uniref:Copper-exporting P-type ATPase n=1 Tax=Photobacterium aphoticum TaxID=754436 RepID=A0A0J1JHH8_9GAMM|nr:copper-translocating P-type ATPase [Photobacterium aphoticum]KLV01392.1 copper-transporting ATPase [Photobacterium aphoticum]PSU53831.1 heavy metal translocating P-type ATPase [Photobacterium aphoticum]GHA64247.1 copper transporter [Photobacterium aphoticum]